MSLTQIQRSNMLHSIIRLEFNLETGMFPTDVKEQEKIDTRKKELEQLNDDDLTQVMYFRNTGIDPRFKEPNLLELIHNELDKFHKLDHKEKLALFLIRTTAELKNPTERCSAALKGDSSAGKDNLIKTTLMLFPEEDNFFLTRGTQAALEDGLKNVKCVAFSEINKNRDNGANSELTEVFKQLAEGGTETIKKDVNTGYRTTIRNKQEQKTLFYGTTETESDEELETRYVIIPVKGYETKNKVVVDDFLDGVSSPQNILNKKEKPEWIKQSIKNLNHDVEIVIPYAHLLKNKIKDTDGKEKYLFDMKKERVKRDVKRLISITKAITWLHQKQRTIKNIDGKNFVYSEPSDFLTAIKLFADFFNLTYYGLDHRIQKVLDKIKEDEGKHDNHIMTFGYPAQYYGWVVRHILQQELGIQSKNTIKERLAILKDMQLIEDFYDHNVNPKALLIKSIGYQEGVNWVSLPVSLTALTPYLTAYLTPTIIEKIYDNKKISPIQLPLENFGVHIQEIDTLKIDTLNSAENTGSNSQSSTQKDNLAISEGETKK